MSLAWVFLFLVAERIFELYLSDRNGKILKARGGKEYYKETFPLIVLLHVGFLVALFLESYPEIILARSTMNHVTWIALIVFILLQGLRYWCMASLGEYWNTRIIAVAGTQLRRLGPYRLLRHPNYLGVTLEFLVLSILMRAPLTFLIFFPFHLRLLIQRISLEEEVLGKLTHY